MNNENILPCVGCGEIPEIDENCDGVTVSCVNKECPRNCWFDTDSDSVFFNRFCVYSREEAIEVWNSYQIKPCPHCGGKMKFANSGTKDKPIWSFYTESHKKDCFLLLCTEIHSLKELVSAWNKRAVDKCVSSCKCMQEDKSK